ncbi:MAG: uracil-DNA glycosylase [Verrucomicrobia bacterium]|nr:uracil-DNA glycosylase [Verrucomicrobiota bacterium]
MHAALTILTDELRRLKAQGVKNVSISPDSVATLRRVVQARKGTQPAAAPAAEPASAGRLAVTAVREPAPAAKAESAPAPEPKLPPPPPFTLPEGTKEERMAALRTIVLNDPECAKHVRPGKKIVVGVGTLDAKIMFVGEAPGAEEEVQGEPFVGPAGQLLTKMIQGMGLKREGVYIGNIMNWRPELPVGAGGVQYGNRAPTVEEMSYCLPYLRAQLAIVNPDVIVALGATAAQGLLGFGTFKTLGEVRGRWKDFEGKPLMVTYHPSYILREPTNKKKRMIWEDLLMVMERAGLPVSEKQRGYFLDK